MDKKNWVRSFIPPCVQKGDVDLVGHVKVTPPTIQQMLELGDRQSMEEKEGVANSVKSMNNSKWVKDFIVEVDFKDSEGREIKSWDELCSSNEFYRPMSEIVHAVINGDYGKKPLTKTN